MNDSCTKQRDARAGRGRSPPTPLRLREVPRPPQPAPVPTAPLHPGSLPRQLRQIQNPPLERETPPATPPLPVARCPCLAECLLYTRPCSHHRPRVAEGRAASSPRPRGRRGQGVDVGTTACSVPPGATCVWVHGWMEGRTDRPLVQLAARPWECSPRPPPLASLPPAGAPTLTSRPRTDPACSPLGSGAGERVPEGNAH